MDQPTPRLIHRSDAPILTLDRPWEDGNHTNAISAMKDPYSDDLLLYYLVSNWSDPLRNVLCLARSGDGVTWAKKLAENAEVDAHGNIGRDAKAVRGFEEEEGEFVCRILP